jgi:hypothetical protein
MLHRYSPQEVRRPDASEPNCCCERLIHVGLRRCPSRTKSLIVLRVQARTIAMAGAICMIMLLVTTSPSPVAADPTASPNPSDFSCAVPALPHGVARSSSSTANLSGPAVSALTGGAARHGFSLDGGDLVVKAPRPGDVPLLSANQAICGAMASTGYLSASVAQGVAVGYGRVSVAARFFPAITGFPSPGQSAGMYPTVPSFHNRLAWLVVVHRDPAAFSCPAERSPVHLVTRPSDHGYEVFMIDARTGTDALVYQEGGPGGCTNGARVPPSVAVVRESVSVPWTLTARNPDGYSGTIAAVVLPCDQVPSTVLVDSGGPNVVVQVTRPFGPSCGPPETVPISLQAATVTSDLPAVIGHDPVGLTNLLSFHVSTPPGTSPVTTTTSPALVPVDISTNEVSLPSTPSVTTCESSPRRADHRAMAADSPPEDSKTNPTRFPQPLPCFDGRPKSMKRQTSGDRWIALAGTGPRS